MPTSSQNVYYTIVHRTCTTISITLLLKDQQLNIFFATERRRHDMVHDNNGTILLVEIFTSFPQVMVSPSIASWNEQVVIFSSLKTVKKKLYLM